MIEGVDTSHIDPTVDDGADREMRLRPCARHTWCIRAEHPANERCVVVARYAMDRSDFGPKAATRRRP